MYPHVTQFETPEHRRQRARALATLVTPRPPRRRRLRLFTRHQAAPAGC